MTEQVDNGSDGVRPRVPMWIATISVIVALVSASVLVYLLYKETRGPGEILREFARRVDRHDCEGSYDLLDPGLRSSVPEETWCSEVLTAVDESLDADFALERAVLEGDVAFVDVSGVTWTEWVLSRHGERSWRIAGTPMGGPFGDYVLPGEFSP